MEKSRLILSLLLVACSAIGQTPAVRYNAATGAITEPGASQLSAFRTSLGLAIGTNVQAYDADLTTWAGITPATGVGTALAIAPGSSGGFLTNSTTTNGLALAFSPAGSGSVTIAPGGAAAINAGSTLSLTSAGGSAITITSSGAGTMNNMVIGGTTPLAGTFTTLLANTSAAVGLGATTPPTALTVGDTSTSSPRGIMSWQSNTGTDGARLHLRKSRGTFASPSVVVTGDTLGRMVATGYDGANFLEMGSININATGTIAPTRVPTQMVFQTATDATPSVLTTALTLGANQSAAFSGAITGTSLALNGATIGSNALAVTGTSAFSSTIYGDTTTPNITLNNANGAALNYGSSSAFVAGGAAHIDISSTAKLQISSGAVTIASASTLGWTSSGAASGTLDAILARDGAASIQMGINAAGVTNQMFKGPDRITSDGVGGNLTIAGGRNRGASAGGSVIIQTSPAAGAGVTGTLATALTIDSNKTATFVGIIADTKIALGTLGVGVTTFAITNNVVTVAGDSGGNTIATITGGVSGMILTIIFTNDKITITDDATATANTINLSAAFTSSANDVMQLVFDGTSWFEVSRSVN